MSAGRPLCGHGRRHYVVSLIGAQGAINGILKLCFGPLELYFLVFIRAAAAGRSAVRWCRRDRFYEVADLVLGKVPGDVGLADDADQFVPIDDREATSPCSFMVRSASSTESSASTVTGLPSANSATFVVAGSPPAAMHFTM